MKKDRSKQREGKREKHGKKIWKPYFPSSPLLQRDIGFKGGELWDKLIPKKSPFHTNGWENRIGTNYNNYYTPHKNPLSQKLAAACEGYENRTKKK